MHLTVKKNLRSGSDIYDQHSAKRHFHRGLIVQPLLHLSLVYLCKSDKSMLSLSPLTPLCCRPGLCLEIFRDISRRGFLLVLGCQSWSMRHLQRTLGLKFLAHWFSWSLTNYVSFLQVNNPFKPQLLFREHLEAKFISHHQPWHFMKVSALTGKVRRSGWDPGRPCSAQRNQKINLIPL